MVEAIQKRKEQGFTIVEVMIVLAIAGLVILIVFLAVPALQRNSRNTQRTNDIASIGGAINEYVSNNAGKLPADDAAFIAGVENNIEPGFYDKTVPANIVYTKNTSLAARAWPTTTEVVHIHTFTGCTGNAQKTSGVTSRNVAALYQLESNGGMIPQCKEL